jgi:hypothetical protein
MANGSTGIFGTPGANWQDPAALQPWQNPDEIERQKLAAIAKQNADNLAAAHLTIANGSAMTPAQLQTAFDISSQNADMTPTPAHQTPGNTYFDPSAGIAAYGIPAIGQVNSGDRALSVLQAGGTATNFPTSRDAGAKTVAAEPKDFVRTGPNTAYFGDQKLLIAPDGSVTNFPTSGDISQHAVKVPASTTADYVQNLERNAVPAKVTAPSPFPQTQDEWKMRQIEDASRGVDLATTRFGERGQRITLSKKEQAALTAGLIASYDGAKTALNLLPGQSSADTKSLIEGPMGKTYTNDLIRAQQEMDSSKVAAKFAGVKSIEDVNKIVEGMSTFDPKLANQFKVMAERKLARANPGMFQEIQRAELLSTSNDAALASYGDIKGKDMPGYPASGTERERADWTRKNLADKYSTDMGGVQAVINPVTGEKAALYPSVGPSSGVLTQAERERVVGKNVDGVEQTAGFVETTLNAQIDSYRRSGKPEHLALIPALEAQKQNLYATAVKLRQEAQATITSAPVSSLADSVGDGTQPDKQALAMKEWETNAGPLDKPYIHVNSVLGQEAASSDVLPEKMVVPGDGDGKFYSSQAGAEIKTLAPEVAAEMASRITANPDKIGSVLSDSIKEVLSKHKGAVEIYGDNADFYVSELAQAAKDSFKERADKAFANVEDKKMAGMQNDVNAFIVGAPINPAAAGDAYKAVQGKILQPNSQQFIIDNNVGGDSKALDTPEDYTLAYIAMNYPGMKNAAKQVLSGLTVPAALQRVKNVVMAMREQLNVQLNADTAVKTAKAIEDERVWTKTELPKMMTQNRAAVSYLSGKGYSPRQISFMRVEAGDRAFFTDNSANLIAMQQLVASDGSANKTISGDLIALLGTNLETGLVGGSVGEGVMARLPYVASGNLDKMFGAMSPAHGGYQLADGKETMKAFSDSQVSFANAAADKTQSKAFVPTFPAKLKDFFDNPNNLAVRNSWIEASKKGGNTGIPMALTAVLMAVQGTINEAAQTVIKTNKEIAAPAENGLRDTVIQFANVAVGDKIDVSSIMDNEFAPGSQGAAGVIRNMVVASLNPNNSNYKLMDDRDRANIGQWARDVLRADSLNKRVDKSLRDSGINVPPSTPDSVDFANEIISGLGIRLAPAINADGSLPGTLYNYAAQDILAKTGFGETVKGKSGQALIDAKNAVILAKADELMKKDRANAIKYAEAYRAAGGK